MPESTTATTYRTAVRPGSIPPPRPLMYGRPLTDTPAPRCDSCRRRVATIAITIADGAHDTRPFNVCEGCTP